MGTEFDYGMVEKCWRQILVMVSLMPPLKCKWKVRCYLTAIFKNVKYLFERSAKIARMSNRRLKNNAHCLLRVTTPLTACNGRVV